MKQKTNNKLVKILVNGEDKNMYYSSYNRAGLRVGLQAGQVQRALEKYIEYDTFIGKVVFVLVDGSEIPYKYINN